MERSGNILKAHVVGKNRFHVGLIAGILVALFFGVAVYFRIALPHSEVFAGNWIKFTGNDAYYFMRQVDSLVHNFPHAISFDPYLLYPGGQSISSQSFFVYLLSGIAWLLGFGSPTQHTVDTIGIYLPAILGALSVIPVYFIGKELFNRWAGVIAAGLLAIAPGEFMSRTIIGFTDRDSLEVMLTVLTMLFLILAIKSARREELDFNPVHLGRTVIKPLIYSLLTGIFLGLYLQTWRGALIFLFIIFIYCIIQSIIDHLKHRDISYLGFTGTITFLVALIIYFPSHLSQASLAPLVIALFTPPLLAATSWLMSKTGAKVGYYLPTLLGIGLAGLAFLYVANPSIIKSILAQLETFSLSETRATIFEMQPILYPYGRFSFSAIWSNFTTGSFLSLISLCILIYVAIKRSEADKTLILVWSLVILVLTLTMRRLALLYAINAAILSGYLAWLMLNAAGLKEKSDTIAETHQEAISEKKKRKKQRRATLQRPNRLKIGLALVAVFFLFFFPNITPAKDIADEPAYAPSDGWYESLAWIKDNTPEPFGDPVFYYASYTRPFRYPETAYGITAWWDYGYLICRMGHRIPSCNPGNYKGRQMVASLFTAQSEASAAPIINKLKSRYLMVDYDTSVMALSGYNLNVYNLVGKFYAVARYAEINTDKLYEVYFQIKDNTPVPILLFYPEYYRSLAVKLFNFNGAKFIPPDTGVVSYEEKLNSQGVTYKQMISLKPFPSYEKAEAYIAEQKSGNYRIVSADPFVSPVPLEKLEQYKLVYSSNTRQKSTYSGMVPQVKIFEYIPK